MSMSIYNTNRWPNQSFYVEKDLKLYSLSISMEPCLLYYFVNYIHLYFKQITSINFMLRGLFLRSTSRCRSIRSLISKIKVFCMFICLIERQAALAGLLLCKISTVSAVVRVESYSCFSIKVLEDPKSCGGKLCVNLYSRLQKLSISAGTGKSSIAASYCKIV